MSDSSRQGETHKSRDNYLTKKAITNEIRVSVVILSVGSSNRIGTLKPLLKVGNQTLLARCAKLFRDAGVDDIVVVVGYGASLTIPIVQSCGARTVINKRFEEAMFSSIGFFIQLL